MRQSKNTWDQIKAGYAAGIGLREIARKMNVPEGTVLARAKREAWTQQMTVKPLTSCMNEWLHNSKLYNNARLRSVRLAQSHIRDKNQARVRLIQSVIFLRNSRSQRYWQTSACATQTANVN